MSIIDDALKKARRIKKEKLSAALLQPGAQPQQLKQEVKRDNPSGIKASAPNRKAPLGLILYAAGALALVVFGIMMLLRGKSDNVSDAVEAPPQIQTMPILPAETAKKEATPNISLKKSTGASDAHNFVLTGVIHGEGEPMAIINGSVYMKGDTVDEAVISSIGKDSVILKKGGNELILRVK